MGTFLEKIIEAKKVRVEAVKAKSDLAQLKERATRFTRGNGRFLQALSDIKKTNIIAEYKRASPSKGIINDRLSPATTGTAYQNGGAAAISVLTEEDFFRGSIEDLVSIRNVVDIPILRKDFVIDEFQIYESAAVGADAILLIVAALDPVALTHFHSLAYNIGLDVLVEVHDEAELEIAATLGSKIIGVNNRNLSTFEVSLDVSRRLGKLARANCLLVSESGIQDREDILSLQKIGYSAFLIGETLMRAGDPQVTLENWTEQTSSTI